MSEPPAISPADAARPVMGDAESFGGTVLRRVRYAVAVGISAVLFWTLGWAVAAPPPQYAGISLTAWPGPSALLAVLALAALLVVATAIGSLLCHPDSPHQGLWCAMLGVTALSVRGGTSFTLVQQAQLGGVAAYGTLCRMFALECIHWSVLFLLAETFARFVHDTFLANTRWITRISEEAAARVVRRPLVIAGGGSVFLAIRGSMGLAKAIGRANFSKPVAGVLGVATNMLLGALMLFVLLQTQAKGQVIAACFFSFFVSTFLSALAFPNVSVLLLILAAPATAAVGYLYAAGYPGLMPPGGYPGHPGNFFVRALPIDFFSAGIPGAITGFYLAFPHYVPLYGVGQLQRGRALKMECPNTALLPIISVRSFRRCCPRCPHAVRSVR